MLYVYTMSRTETKQWNAGDKEAVAATLKYARMQAADVKATSIMIQREDGSQAFKEIE